MTILLRDEHIAQLISVRDAIEAVATGLREQAAGQIQLPLRMTVDTPTGWLRYMPAIMAGSGYMGYKVMHSAKGIGVGYLVTLYDLASGQLLALIDAANLTALRTAATTAIATEFLARPDATALGVLGSGEQARVHLTAMCAVRNIQRVTVFSPRTEHRQEFAELMSRQVRATVEAVNHPRDAVRDSDIVVIAVRADHEPVFYGEWLASGMHVNGISSVRPTAREIDDAVWTKSDVIAVDDRVHVLESGDGRSLLRTRAIDPERMVELWELVGRTRPGRQRSNEITLFKSVGNALQDLALAVALYRRAIEAGVGDDLGDIPRLKRP